MSSWTFWTCLSIFCMLNTGLLRTAYFLHRVAEAPDGLVDKRPLARQGRRPRTGAFGRGRLAGVRGLVEHEPQPVRRPEHTRKRLADDASVLDIFEPLEMEPMTDAEHDLVAGDSARRALEQIRMHRPGLLLDVVHYRGPLRAQAVDCEGRPRCEDGGRGLFRRETCRGRRSSRGGDARRAIRSSGGRGGRRLERLGGRNLA